MSRIETRIIATLAAISVVFRAVAFFNYRFDSDEPQHLHVAWGWTAGLLQYRDLFDNHAPLFHMLTAPLLALADERQQRSGEHVEERRVVVEEVAVLQQSGGPSPRYVQVLRLVGIEAVVEEGDGAEDDGDGGKSRDDPRFDSRHAAHMIA